MPADLHTKQLIVFDLDGTLTASKADLTEDMADLMRRLLEVKKVAVIGGGKYAQFQKQFLKKLKAPPALLANLFIFPTTATSFYVYDGAWKKIYSEELSIEQRRRVKKAFRDTFRELKYKNPKKIYGPVIEDRGTQITFSALGQKAPLAAKEKWRKANEKLKRKIASKMQEHLPDLEVRASGFTSVDITQKGIDKAYGIGQIEKNLGMPVGDMLFVGDALFPGGNDYAARRTGVACVAVKGPQDTARLIRKILK